MLLSSLQGTAVTAIKVENVLHEFSSIDGVREDVTDIVLNIKSLALNMHSEGVKKMSLNVTGPGEITAGMINAPSEIDIVDPEHHIATLNSEGSINMTLKVTRGRGFVPVKPLDEDEGQETGLLRLDATYSPVKRVTYQVDNARVEQRTNLDRLDHRWRPNARR